MNKHTKQKTIEIRDRLINAHSDIISEDRKMEIADFHFKYSRPRDKLCLDIMERYNLDKKMVCDLGCGYGHYLSHFTNPDSYGIEISNEHIEVCKMLNLNVHHRDFIKEKINDLPKVDVLWTIATIEHVDSPHVFLRKANILMKEGATMILECPIRPPFAFYKHLPILKSLYDEHGDHVNFFTVDTLRWYFERTGFKVKTYYKWSAALVNRINIRPTYTGIFPLSLLTHDVVFVCEKVKDWDYPERSIRKAAENHNGYVFKDSVKDLELD